MSPKALSICFTPLFPRLRLQTPPIPNSLKPYRTKPTTVLCKSTGSRFHEPSPSISEPAGTGAAAPTRGDILIERQLAKAASAMVVLGDANMKKKKKKGKSALKMSTAVSSCYGCGAPLQTSDVEAPGYVDSKTYELKKKHHQLRSVLCGRCRLLSHGHMITAVGGNGGYSGGKQFVTAEELREKLSHLRHEKALIVKLVDIVDFNGSFLVRVRDLAGANPIIFVVTKVDLLPKETDFNCIGDWVVEATAKKKLNVVSVHLTSSKSLVGITGVVSEIQREKKGRNVYILDNLTKKTIDIVRERERLYYWEESRTLTSEPSQGFQGSANVGKSAFINALLKIMSYKDPVAASAQRHKPMQSAVPGTTLGPIPIDAFFGGEKLYDTPGVHLHHRLAAVVHSEDLPSLAPLSRLRGQTFNVANEETAGKNGSNCLNGCSIFWGGLTRIDVIKVLPQTRLTFYGPKNLTIHVVPTDEADKFYQKEVGLLLTPPTGKQKVDAWMGLEAEHQLQIKFKDEDRPACDVAISGLGWIAVDPMSRSCEEPDSDAKGTAKELHLAVHVPKPVEIFVRPPMPVGKAGKEWYQYRDLTEKEEASRPRWFF